MNTPQTTERSLHDSVCEEIRVILARRRMSQAEVARRAGWSAFYLSNRMNGKTPMNVNDLAALSRILGVPVTAFFPREDSQIIRIVCQILSLPAMTHESVTCQTDPCNWTLAA